MLVFFTDLLGSKAEELVGVDVQVIRAGRTLTSQDYDDLIRPISVVEIDQALHSIHSLKARCIDGFNSFFFKKVCHIVKMDIYHVCNMFFKYCKIQRSINCTSISLIPKVSNPSYPKDFRPISCANVLYKLIAKVLAARLQKVSPIVVCNAQSGFIPRRQILDNVLLALEIIKGYRTKSVSP